MAKWGSFKFDEIEKLAKSFQEALDERVIDRFMQEFLLEMAWRALKKIKKRTPVNSGDLRHKWKFGKIIRMGDAYVVELFNPLEFSSFIEYGFRAHWVPGHWEGNRFVYDKAAIKLSKEARAAYREKYGSTGMMVGKKNGWVQGRFMMTISMQEMEREMPKYLAKRQMELLEQIMNGRPPKKGG